MVEESKQEIQEDQTAYSNDQLVRAQIMEIHDDMPEEVKRQIQQFNEMSMMLNNSLDNPIAEEEDSEEDDDDDNEASTSESTSPAPSFSEDSNAVYQDLF